ncbi:hypothetical protein OPV22_011826 [Ensete ventricosum]|uniref:Uncharacterized protein n=1 Tax=Ensete ventricosum TaxID=4639 RepID=A0AAV8RG87_ENSVE|nr:hypothetical protein OPV22_011826 [Ensete ventricosum]
METRSSPAAAAAAASRILDSWWRIQTKLLRLPLRDYINLSFGASAIIAMNSVACRTHMWDARIPLKVPPPKFPECRKVGDDHGMRVALQHFNFNSPLYHHVLQPSVWG